MRRDPCKQQQQQQVMAENKNKRTVSLTLKWRQFIKPRMALSKMTSSFWLIKTRKHINLRPWNDFLEGTEFLGRISMTLHLKRFKIEH